MFKILLFFVSFGGISNHIKNNEKEVLSHPIQIENPYFLDVQEISLSEPLPESYQKIKDLLLSDENPRTKTLNCMYIALLALNAKTMIQSLKDASNNFETSCSSFEKSMNHCCNAGLAMALGYNVFVFILNQNKNILNPIFLREKTSKIFSKAYSRILYGTNIQHNAYDDTVLPETRVRFHRVFSCIRDVAKILFSNSHEVTTALLLSNKLEESYVIYTKNNSIFACPEKLGWISINDDSEIAFLVAHELAHIIKMHLNKRGVSVLPFLDRGFFNSQKDGLKNLISIKKTNLRKLFSFDLKVFRDLILVYSISQNQEYEADEIGLYLMILAGYDPKKSIVALKKLYAFDENNIGPNFKIIHSHPSLLNRVNELEKKIKSLEDSINSIVPLSLTGDKKEDKIISFDLNLESNICDY